jgi:hypothetical protein
MAELTMFAYPWDLAGTDPDAVLGELAALGVDRLALAVTYHSAETIAPRRRDRVHVQAEANVAHLPLPDSAFAGLRPAAGALAREDPDLVPRLATAARAAGLALTAWTVVLHNSDLAAAHPQAALRNCFGDPSAHGLCPTNPAVRRYVRDLCAAVGDYRCFDELMVESVAFLPAGHGHPHELWGVRMDPATRLLLSLCFCTSCLAEGERLGIDGSALRAWCAEELHRTWNSPLAPLRRPDDGAELSGLLLARPDLYAWARMRREVVTSIFADLASHAAGTGTAIAAGTAVWARPGPIGWLEGIDLAGLAGICGRVTLMPYYPDLGDVARDLDHALAFVPAERIQLLQTLWPRHHGGPAGLLSKVEAAAEAGVDQIGLYNFTLAPAPVLGWVRQVADLIHGSSGR